MGYRIAEEVLDHCPNLPYRQFRVLMVLALDATDSTRLAKPGMNTIALRANSSHRTARRTLSALQQRGLIKAVRHAAPGVRAIYEILPIAGSGATVLARDSGATVLARERGPDTNNTGQNRANRGPIPVAHTEPSTEPSALSRAERSLRARLAELGADERETAFIVAKAKQDPGIDKPIAYLRKALDNGDGPELLSEIRDILAAIDRRRAAWAAARQPEPEPADDLWDDEPEPGPDPEPGMWWDDEREPEPEDEYGDEEAADDLPF
jgi:hypothetical protein